MLKDALKFLHKTQHRIANIMKNINEIIKWYCNGYNYTITCIQFYDAE